MQIPLSIVIPMYNEEDNVSGLINEIHTGLYEKCTFEIIVVDDGSTDATLARLQQLATQLDELVVVSHKKNAGQSTALVTGARKARYDWLVTLDGDGQNNPADIATLHQICQEKLQSMNKPFAILGNRSQRHDTWFRRVSSRIANGVRNALLKDNCPDTGCSLKMFPKDLFLQLPHFNHVHRFMPALFQRAGAELFNVPVDHRPRTLGTSKYGLHNRLWAGIVDLFGVLWLLKRPCKVELR